MFSEIVKLIPQVDRSGLNTMFRDLNGRFGQVARKFGDGMKNALKFGGIAALATGLLAKLLNPLQRAEEVIDRILSKGDNAVTNAQEFGTTPGKLLRLEAVGQAKGVDADTMRTLLGKFQIAVAKEQEAAAAPARIQQKLAKETDPDKRAILEQELKVAVAEKKKGGLLHEFIGIKDTADAFFAFVQSVGKLEPSQRTVVQSQVFGEKVRGKASEFFNANDFASILKQLPSNEVLTKAANKANDLSDKRDLLQAIRETNAFANQTGFVNDKQITDIEKSKSLQDKRDIEDLKRFDALKVTAIAMEQLTAKMDKFLTEIGTNVLPQLVKGIEVISKFLPTVGQAQKSVNSVVDPVLQGAANALEFRPIPGASNVNEIIDDPMQALRNDVAAIRTFVEGAWAQFKTSPVYRGISFFGGK